MTTTWPLRLTLRAYSADEIVEYMQVYEGEDRTEAGEYILAAEHDRLMAEKDAEIERLKDERDEALRRRDGWRAKAMEDGTDG